MTARHERFSALRRVLLLGCGAIAAGFALSLAAANSASAAEEGPEGSGLLGTVAAVTGAVSSTIDEVDTAVGAVVEHAAPVTEPVEAVVPAPIVAPVPAVSETASEITQTTVDHVEATTDGVVGTVEGIVESGPATAATQLVISRAAEIPVVGTVVDSVVPEPLVDVVTDLSSSLDETLVGLVGNSSGPAITLPAVPTGILDGIVGIVAPGTDPATYPEPVATPDSGAKGTDPAVGAAAMGVASVPVTSWNEPPDGRAHSQPPPLPDPPAYGAAASAGDSSLPPQAASGGPLPGSCTLGSGASGAGAGTLHVALADHALPTLLAGTTASVSSDAVPDTPTYATDVSPD